MTNKAKQQPISLTLHHPPFKVPQSGGSIEAGCEEKVFDEKVIDGRPFRKSPGKAFEDLEYTNEVTFSAAITEQRT